MTTAIGGGAGAAEETQTCVFCQEKMVDPSVIQRIQNATDRQRELTKVVQESLQNAPTLAESQGAVFPLHMARDHQGRKTNPHFVHFQCYVGQIKATPLMAKKCVLCREKLGDLPSRVSDAITNPPPPPPPLATRIALAVAGMFELLLAVPLLITFGLAGMSMPAAACLDLVDQGVRMITRGDSRLQWNTVNKVFNSAGAKVVAQKVIVAALGCLPVPILSPLCFVLATQADSATAGS